MLGLELDFWDYATFATAALAGGSVMLNYIWIAGRTGRVQVALTSCLNLLGSDAYLRPKIEALRSGPSSRIQMVFAFDERPMRAVARRDVRGTLRVRT